MEGVSKSFYRGKACRRTRRRKLPVIQLGRTGGSNQGRLFFRQVKADTKLRFSPKRFFISLRDAYVNFMIRIANGAPAIGGVYDGVVGGSFVGFGKGALKEYDEKIIAKMYTRGPFTGLDDKMIAQIYRYELSKCREKKIYKSLVVAQGQLETRDATRLNDRIVFRY